MERPLHVVQKTEKNQENKLKISGDIPELVPKGQLSLTTNNF